MNKLNTATLIATPHVVVAGANVGFCLYQLTDGGHDLWGTVLFSFLLMLSVALILVWLAFVLSVKQELEAGP
jgi:hypothetical protein